MKRFSVSLLDNIGMQIFSACGTPKDEAAIVTHHLIEASLCGLDSHGVIRYIWYADEVLGERIRPGAETTVTKESDTTIILDGGKNFGAVVATHALKHALRKAERKHISYSVAHNCHHVGRLGAFAEQAARNGLICIAMASWPISGHYVAPWGGMEGRLATNPIAYGIPTHNKPLVFDMSTSGISEGKIRMFMHQGVDLPENCLIDADGRPTRDPKDFFTSPPGTILPFGGHQGFKGFGLAILSEVLSGALSGDVITDKGIYGNRICLIVIDPKHFLAGNQFQESMHAIVDYMKNTTAAEGFDGVLLPGEYYEKKKEDRLRNGIPLDDETWSQILETARRLGLDTEKWEDIDG